MIQVDVVTCTRLPALGDDGDGPPSRIFLTLILSLGSMFPGLELRTGEMSWQADSARCTMTDVHSTPLGEDENCFISDWSDEGGAEAEAEAGSELEMGGGGGGSVKPSPSRSWDTKHSK